MTDIIIWDWNGTLLNDTDICISCINLMLKQRGKTGISHERYKEIFTFPVKEYYIRAGFDFSEEPFEIPAHQFIELYRSQVRKSPLQPGTIEILTSLHKKGYRQVVLSAMEQELLMETLADKGIVGYFEAIQGIRDHLGGGKTGAARELITSMGAPMENLYLIGDTIHDHEVAAELGIACILVAHGHQSFTRLKASGRPVLENLSELDFLF